MTDKETPPPAANPVPANTIQASILPGVPHDVASWIRPCKPTRQWMDNVPQKYIYRCIPMVAANTMGWEILNPVETTLLWDGESSNTSLTSTPTSANAFAATSHFGCGIATWYLPFLFRTSPELGLVVTGPANHDRNDAVPLDAFVRTDWLPFPFTMNWRLLNKNTPVTFKANEPICRIYPFPIALLENTKLEIHSLAEDPAFMADVEKWGQTRQKNVEKQQADAQNWLKTGEEPTGDGVWNSQYVRARARDTGDTFSPHQTVFKCQEPIDKRR